MKIAKDPPAEAPGITKCTHQITSERVEELMQLKNQQEAAAKAAKRSLRGNAKPLAMPPAKRRRKLQRCK